MGKTYSFLFSRFPIVEIKPLERQYKSEHEILPYNSHLQGNIRCYTRGLEDGERWFRCGRVRFSRGMLDK